MIAENLRNEIGLRNFLSPSIDREPAGDDRRTALLNRALVMASHGHMSRCIEDLRSANIFDPMTPDQWVIGRKMILQCAQIGYSADEILSNHQPLSAQILATHSKPAARTILRTLALGLLKYAKGHPMPLGKRARAIMISVKLFLS